MQILFLLLRLSIFAGGLWAIDLILLALAYWLYYQAKQKVKGTGYGIWTASTGKGAVVVVGMWIISIIIRALSI